ncbi:hypothetical protein K501DRAFT_266759 [Backusella circina FSU 941]|nr:hypothetical protein K501DRAFT_266759 [Backusella circina FSU 941]
MANLEKYYVIHTYEAQYPDEVTLYIHDQVAVIEKDERYNDGWWLGRSNAGKIGLFPANYVTKITENKKILNTKVIQRNTIESLNQPTLNSNAIREWTPEQVSLWILQIGFDQDIAYNFKDQEISGDVLLELTLESLKELEVSTFGKRFKLLAAINVLREESKRRRTHNVRSNYEAKNSKPKVYPNEKRALDDNSTITRVNTSLKSLTRSYTSGDLRTDHRPRQLLKKVSEDELCRKKLIKKVAQEEFIRKTLKKVPEEDFCLKSAMKTREKISPKASIRIDDFRNVIPQVDSGISHCETSVKPLAAVAADLAGDKMSQLYPNLNSIIITFDCIWN